MDTVNILAIESSCDETSASVCSNGKILSNRIATQAVHAAHGGVVPELASRAHMQNILPVVDVALQESGLALEEMQAIAFTQAPGLIGSLLVGAQFAKSLALAQNIPLIAVNHMQAHVLANLIPERRPSYPFLCLTVSGGHTQIVKCSSATQLEIIGTTIDDAAGEAFDKAAKMLGLPYPGGPLVDKHARLGNPNRFTFPEPRIAGYDFSFSGLKTAILYFLRNAGTSLVYKEAFAATEEERKSFIDNNLDDICASIQERIVTILLNKFKKAANDLGINHLCIAGGVSANSGLRASFEAMGQQEGWQTYIPEFQFCTDNAGMIAIAGYHKFLAQDFADLSVPSMARGF